MSDRTFTVHAEFTFRVDDEQTARNRLALVTAGTPGLIATRIARVVEGSERTWEDDCREAERAADRDDNRPVSETELLRGYDADRVARSRPTPDRIKHVTKPWPR